MSLGKRIALTRGAQTPVTDSDSAFGEDYDDDFGRSHKRACSGKDKMNRNLSEKKRRDQFNMLVNELCTMVSTTNKKMDKSTVLKSTIAFLKTHQETTDQQHVHEIKEDWKPSFLTNDEFMHLMLEALDSFLLMFSQQGIILYASDSVTSLLGHLPNDMINKSIYDFVTKDESTNLHNILYNYRIATANGVPDFEKEENQLCFECKFRRGTTDPRDSVCYETVTVRGSFRHTSSQTGEEPLASPDILEANQVCFCSTVRMKTPQLVREMSIVDDSKEFTSRHSLEWKFLFLDHRAPPIIGYLPFEVLGTSGYDYYHPDDLDCVTKSHEQLMKTGEGTSCYYRFLTKGQQWIWLKTHYFITYHQWNSKPEFINCTNTVVSYCDVRSQKRKDLGIVEEDIMKQELESSSFSHKSQLSPSVGSVNSVNNRAESWQSSPNKESKNNDNNSVASMSSKDQTEAPTVATSTSHLRSRTVSEQLQQFLHRHIRQQAQASQSATTTTTPQSTSGSQTATVSTTETSFPPAQLQQVLGSRSPSVQKQESHYQRILPRVTTSSSSDIPNRTVSTENKNQQPPVSVTLITSPANTVITDQQSPMPTMNVPATVYMTPVQRQLHEQLQRKALQMQEAIMKQQEELKKITQQLTMAQGTIPIPVFNSNSDNLLGVVNGPQVQIATPSQNLQPQLQQQQQQMQFSQLNQQQQQIQIQQQQVQQIQQQQQIQQSQQQQIQQQQQQSQQMQQQHIQQSSQHQQQQSQQQIQHQQQSQLQQQLQQQQVQQQVQQQQQPQVQTSQSQQTGTQNVLVNQSNFLPFPILSQDSDEYLNLLDPLDMN